jgi:hypothetical protein
MPLLADLRPVSGGFLLPDFLLDCPRRGLGSRLFTVKNLAQRLLVKLFLKLIADMSTVREIYL